MTIVSRSEDEWSTAVYEDIEVGEFEDVGEGAEGCVEDVGEVAGGGDDDGGCSIHFELRNFIVFVEICGTVIDKDAFFFSNRVDYVVSREKKARFSSMHTHFARALRDIQS